MIRSFKSEMQKLLRRPMVMGVVGSMVGFTILATFLAFSTAGSGSSDGGREISSATPADLAEASGLVEGVAAATMFLGVIAVVVVAWKVAGEFGNGTIRNLLIRQPSRVKLLGGKLLALWTFVGIAVLAAVAVSVGAAALLAPAYDISTSAWFTAEGLGAVVSVTTNLLVAVAGYAAIGALLGIVVQSAAPAIGIALAWLLPVESLLAKFGDTAGDYLPGQAFSDLAAGGTQLGFALALAVTLGYVAVGTVGSMALFKSRDVTA